MTELLDSQELAVKSNGGVVVDVPSNNDDDISDTGFCYTHDCEEKNIRALVSLPLEGMILTVAENSDYWL